MAKNLMKYGRVALSLAGSAILLFSCGEKDPEADAHAETLMTEYCDHLSVIRSRNGRRSYHFTTPLLEGYTLAREPYREFRKGVKITTYQDDSLTSVDAVLTANYAIYYENRELWEAKGDVVVRKSDGKTLYTQQLFWNAQTDKVYSNVDSKIVQNNGRDVFIGEGFESDASFKEWRFRRMKGRMEVEMKTVQDSTAVSSDGTAAQQPADKSPEGETATPATKPQPAAPDGAAPAVRPLPAAATPVPTAVPAKAQTAGRATVSAELQPPVPASYEAQAVEAVADDENPTPEN